CNAVNRANPGHLADAVAVESGSRTKGRAEQCTQKGTGSGRLRLTGPLRGELLALSQVLLVVPAAASVIDNRTVAVGAGGAAGRQYGDQGCGGSRFGAHARPSAQAASPPWRVRAEAAALWRLSERNAPSL